LIRPTLKSESSIKSCCAELGSSALPQPSPSTASSLGPDTTATAVVTQGGVAFCRRGATARQLPQLNSEHVRSTMVLAPACKTSSLRQTPNQTKFWSRMHHQPIAPIQCLKEVRYIKISMGLLFPLFH